MKPLFLRLCLIDSLFGCLLAAGRIAYGGHVHVAGVVAIAAVLGLFSLGAAASAFEAWRPRIRQKRLDDIAELAEKLPGVALLGTAAGFLIALSGSAADVQQRVAGASTALASTLVGIAAWLVLSLQHRLLARET